MMVVRRTGWPRPHATTQLIMTVTASTTTVAPSLAPASTIGETLCPPRPLQTVALTTGQGCKMSPAQYLAVFLLSMASLMCGRSAETPRGDLEVVATVNGEPIVVAELRREARRITSEVQPMEVLKE